MSAKEDAMAPSPKQLVDFMSRSLSAFQASPAPLGILCTLPHRGAPAARRPRDGVRRLVVLDSSFNPPTVAHAQMARSGVDSAGPGSRLLLLLAVHNADKAARPASLTVRLAMMEAMARGLLRDGVGADEIDVGVTTRAYFHDKARAVAASGVYDMHDEGGEAAEQVFLVGFDTLVRIFNPKYYHDSSSSSSSSSSRDQHDGGTAAMQSALRPFFHHARLRVTPRADDACGTRDEQRAYVSGLDEAWGRGVELVDDADDATARVSSSRARDAVRAAAGVARLDGLVDGEVRAWIEAEGLYRE